MDSKFDIVIIGAGPGGYVAAIRAAQLGYKTAIVEKYEVLGGTCTNVGCIPSKALLDTTEHYHYMQHKSAQQGIEADGLKLNFTNLIARKDQVVKQNTDGLSFLMKKNKITVITGVGSFLNRNQLQVSGADGVKQLIEARWFIIATGSKPSSLPGITIDKDRIITSTEALSLKEKPASMVIIGGGVIGVEMASVYSRIGVQVTILEYADTLIPAMDRELGPSLQKILTRNGINVVLNAKVQGARNNGTSATVHYLDKAGDGKEITADYCLVAVGRMPYTSGLGLEQAGIDTDEKGRIKTNEHLQTTAANIYAIGDVIAGPMLAHKAEEEGAFVAAHINGQHPHIKYHLIPAVVYTWPEVAGAGYTEEQLKEKGITYRKGKFPFIASGRARAADETDGFVKVLSDPTYGEILGVHIIGSRAADLIAQAVIAMEFEVTDIEMGRISYAHPTFSEALKDAYLSASGQGAINL